MLRIKDPSLVPPGGAFVYRHTKTGAEFRHHTVPQVFELARKHAEANGLEFTGREFTDNICANAAPGVCEEVDDTGMPNIVQRVVNATKAVINHGRHGFKMSEDELYHHRHGICVACPYWAGDTGGTWFAIACRKCGCTGVKLKWQGEHCPIGAW